MMAKLIWKGDQVVAKVVTASREAIDETNEASASRARADAPFRTGSLREGIGTRSATESGTVVSGQLIAAAKHSLFVELGTVNMPAQPFMRPSADAENPHLAARIGSKLK